MDIRIKAEREILRHAVTRKIFCQLTNKILDIKSAIMYEITFTSTNVADIVVDAAAAPEIHDRVLAMANDIKVESVKIYDGRELFGKSGRS